MNRTTRIVYPVILVLALAIGACNEKGDSATPSNSGPRIKQRDTIAPTISSNNGKTFTTDTAPGRKAIPINDPNGFVAFEAEGFVKGTWKFDDVTLTVNPSAKPEALQPLLALEAHKSPPSEHFKIKLFANASEIKPGTYIIDPDQKALPRIQATWEREASVYGDRQNAEGSMTITEIKNGRVKGTFLLALPSLIDKKSPATENIQGSFDVRIQK